MENAKESTSKSTDWRIDVIPFVGRARRFAYLWFLRFKWAALQVSSAVIVIGFLGWLAVFIYGGFHHHYMPLATSFERPIHLQFRTDCDSSNTLCSFPFANISLVTTNGNEILVRGQTYVVKLELEMPESYVNQNLGMFMVQLQFYTIHGVVVHTASRAVMMQFKSVLYRIFETVWLLPYFFFGHVTQKQIIAIEMANEYLVDPYSPTIGLFLEVQSKRIEIYNVSLKINARLFGLGYLLYYWPTLSAVVGIATNFFFLALIAVFSYATYVGRTTRALYLSSEATRLSSEKRTKETDDIKPDSTSTKPVEFGISKRNDPLSTTSKSRSATFVESAEDVLSHFPELPSGDDIGESRNYFVGSTLRHRPVKKED